ncbi:hypothetical protein D9M72_334610 [compost metagenome]
MALHVAARRHGDRHRRDHRGQHRHQRQEALGPVERRTHLRLAGFERLDPGVAQLAAADLLLRPFLVRGTGGVRAGHQQPVGHAAAPADQAGAFKIRQRHQHARREVHEARAAVHLLRDDAVDAEGAAAELQRVAHVQSERAQQGFVDPYRARRGNAFGGRVRRARRAGYPELAAQRIAVGHRLERGQLAGRIGTGGARLAAGRGHARERHRLRHRQPLLPGTLREGGVERMVRDQQHVRGDHLPRIALQPQPHAVGHEADAGQRRHRQHQCEQQQVKLAGKPVAACHAQRLAPGGKPARWRGARAGGGTCVGVGGVDGGLGGHRWFGALSGCCVAVAWLLRGAGAPRVSRKAGDEEYGSGVNGKALGRSRPPRPRAAAAQAGMQPAHAAPQLRQQPDGGHQEQDQHHQEHYRQEERQHQAAGRGQVLGE